jgi:hypothetical protein
MFEKSLCDDRRHEPAGVVLALAAVEAQRERESVSFGTGSRRRSALQVIDPKRNERVGVRAA